MAKSEHFRGRLQQQKLKRKEKKRRKKSINWNTIKFGRVTYLLKQTLKFDVIKCV
jgi:hypothetical protein